MTEDLMTVPKLKETYLDFWKRFTDVKGTANRYEFWVPTIINCIATSILTSISSVLGGILGLAILVPSVCISIRRLNDLDKPWVNIFVNVIPVVGWIIFLIWMIAEGKTDTAVAAVEAPDPAKSQEPTEAEVKSEVNALDDMLGSRDEKKEEAVATEAAAKELDTVLNGDDDPLAREIEDAAKNAAPQS